MRYTLMLTSDDGKVIGEIELESSHRSTWASVDVLNPNLYYIIPTGTYPPRLLREGISNLVCAHEAKRKNTDR